HALLHHTSPRLWLRLLRSESEEGRLARDLFTLRCYYQGRHLPEYEGYTIAEQHELLRIGFRRFKEAFGRTPAAAVTSDAYPETELLWLALGVTALPLKNSRVNTGEVVVYPNKPWINQDIYARLGDIPSVAEAACLVRNVFCEADASLDEVLRAAKAVHGTHHEPIVVSSHRSNYASFAPGRDATNLERLDALLTAFDRMGACYLTSAELASLCLAGCSARRIGNRVLFRRWFDNARIPLFAEGLPVGVHWLSADKASPPDRDFALE
ncbi:MAG: hypothetical protein IJJ33_16785, partial [Victivallales bacterium]|nr:hypothetical protein [Victivallales bacterium]